MWIFNCKEVSRLVSDSMDRELGLGQRIGIRFHLMMCKYCSRFAGQLKQMRDVLKKEIDQVKPCQMDEQVKKQIKSILRSRK